MSIKHAYIYCRCSKQTYYHNTDIPIESSFDSQQEMCKNYCENKNITVKKIVHETGSARDIEQLPKLMDLIDNMENDTLLVVADISRLARNTRQMLNTAQDLVSRNITIFAVHEQCTYGRDTNYMEKHLFRTSLSLAELESDRLSYRLKRSTKHNNFNKMFHKIPFGFENRSKGKTVKLSINKTEVEIYDLIQELIKDNQTFMSIAETLNSLEYTCRGKPWTPKTVKYVSELDEITEKKNLRFEPY